MDSIRESNHRQTKEFICGRAKNNALYAKGYAQKLTSYYGTDYYLRPVIETVERDYSYDDIRLLREAVHDRLKREKKKQHPSNSRERRKSGHKIPQLKIQDKSENEKSEPGTTATTTTTTAAATGENAQVGWVQWAFPTWGGWGTAESKEDSSSPAKDSVETSSATLETTTTTTTTSPEEAERIIEEEIWHMVTESSAESVSLLKKDSVFAHVNFRLDSGTLQLLGDKLPSTASATTPTSPSSQTSPSCQTSSSTSVFLKLDFWNVCVEMESRPRTASALYSLSLGSVLLQV